MIRKEPEALSQGAENTAVTVYNRFALGPSSASPLADGNSPLETPGTIPSVVSAALNEASKPSHHPTPHDLDSRLPGLSDLRALTLGSRSVTIVVLDGTPDLGISALSAETISKQMPYWHKRVAQISHADHALFREIAEADVSEEVRDARFFSAFSNSKLFRFLGDRHATHITSVIAGQVGTPVQGLAPQCRVIVIPLNEMGDPAEYFSALNLSRAFDMANDLGADIIHCAACLPTQTDAPNAMLARAVETCRQQNTLIVAPAGNDAGECRCFPAVLPGALAVGALKDNGQPFKFSNFGGNYAIEGIMAPVENILGAQPGTEEPIREKGTSVAAPVVTGIAALLMSLQRQTGQAVDAEAIRTSLLRTAAPCRVAVDGKVERGLRGALNIPAVMADLFGRSGQGASLSQNPAEVTAKSCPRTETAVKASATDGRRTVASQASGEAPLQQKALSPQALREGGAKIVASTAHSGQVYAIGALGYDFGSEAVAHDFESFMAELDRGDGRAGAAAQEDAQLAAFLDQHPTARQRLIWVLQVDGTQLYALRPSGANAGDIFETLVHLLAGQALGADHADHVDRVSIPGRRLGTGVSLRSGAVLPELDLADLRGLYGWRIKAMVEEAVDQIYPGDDPLRPRLQAMLLSFLNQVYFDLHNLGHTSRDRAMNFAATNCFQAASVFSKAIAEGRELENILVKKSPLCRLHSDCWDLCLTFVDPKAPLRAGKMYQFTLDVSDVLPVTVGEVKSWVFRRPR